MKKGVDEDAFFYGGNGHGAVRLAMMVS